MEIEIKVLGFYKDGKYYEAERRDGKFVFVTDDKDVFEYAKKFAVGEVKQKAEAVKTELTRKEIMAKLKEKGIKFKPTLKTEELLKLLEGQK